MTVEWEPHWTLVRGSSQYPSMRCAKCGELVGEAWQWFERPTLATRCYCPTCAVLVTRN